MESDVDSEEDERTGVYKPPKLSAVHYGRLFVGNAGKKAQYICPSVSVCPQI